MRARDPRISFLMVVLGLGQAAVSQILMWTPPAAVAPVETSQGLPVIRLGGEPAPELPSPLLVAGTVGGLILAAGGIGAWQIFRHHADEPAAPAVDPDALVSVPPPREDPLALDPELRELVETHEQRG